MLCLFYFLVTGSENLHVSHILQKAKIEVSEDGTKASAATSKNWVRRAGLSLSLPLSNYVVNLVPPPPPPGTVGCPSGDRSEFSEDLPAQGSESVSLKKAPQGETFLQDKSWQALSVKSSVVCIFCFVGRPVSTPSFSTPSS